MSSLNDNFTEVLERIRYGREFGHASFEPVYYLVFPPREILEVKRLLPAWKAKLQNSGWVVHCFSMATAIAEILAQAPQRRIWLTADRKAPLDWTRTNKSLTEALTKETPIKKGALQTRFAAWLESHQDEENAILLITDLEALHPYLRIGALEGNLVGKFRVPTVIFYPGERTGKTRLKFLGFYPEDGNYRSVHVGG
jgi:hypothetical protein